MNSTFLKHALHRFAVSLKKEGLTPVCAGYVIFETCFFFEYLK